MGIRVLVWNGKDTVKPVETVSKRFSKIGDRVGGGPGPHYPWNVHNRDPKMGSCCKYLCHVYIYYVHIHATFAHTHTHTYIHIYAWGKKHFHTHTSRDRPRADMNKSWGWKLKAINAPRMRQQRGKDFMGF